MCSISKLIYNFFWQGRSKNRNNFIADSKAKCFLLDNQWKNVECWFDLVLKTKSLELRYIFTWIFVQNKKKYQWRSHFPLQNQNQQRILVFLITVFQVSFLTYGTWPFDLHISKHLHYIHKRWKQTHNGMIFFLEGSFLLKCICIFILL